MPESTDGQMAMQDRILRFACKYALLLCVSQVCSTGLVCLFCVWSLEAYACLCCRGYDMPDLVREGDTGRSCPSSDFPSTIFFSFFFRNSYRRTQETTEQRLNLQPVTSSSPTLYLLYPTSLPPNGTLISSLLTATPFPPNTAPHPRRLRRMFATSPPAM